LSAFYSHPPPAPDAPPEEPVAAAPKAAAAPPAKPQPAAPPPVTPPEEPVAAAPKAAAAAPAKPQPDAPPPPAAVARAVAAALVVLEEKHAQKPVAAAPPAPTPVTPPEEPVAAAPKAAAAALPAKPQPDAPPAPTPVTLALAAAPVGLAEGQALWRERPPIVVRSRSEKPASAPLPPPAWRQAIEASQADSPKFVPRTNASGQAATGKPELAKASRLRLTTAGPSAATDTAIAGHDRQHRAVRPAAAPEPSRFAATPKGAALFKPKSTEPLEDESPKVALFGGSTPVEAGPFRWRTGTLVHYVDDGEPPLRSHEIEELSYRRLRRGLFAGGTLLAVMIAAGVTYVMMQSEKSVAMPPIVDADPALLVPAVTPADDYQRKSLIEDRGGEAKSAEQTKLVTPGNRKVDEVPTQSGDDNSLSSRIIEPAGPGGDAPAKAGDAPGSTDPLSTDVAAGGDDSGQISPEKARTLVVGPPMPVVGSKAASDDDAGKLPPGASLAVPPSATPAAVGAVPKRGRSPETVGVSVSDASGAAPASDNGAAVADDASPVPAAPARVPIPRPKPVVVPDEAGKLLPTPPAVASPGDLY